MEDYGGAWLKRCTLCYIAQSCPVMATSQEFLNITVGTVSTKLALPNACNCPPPAWGVKWVSSSSFSSACTGRHFCAAYIKVKLVRPDFMALEETNMLKRSLAAICRQDLIRCISWGSWVGVSKFLCMTNAARFYHMHLHCLHLLQYLVLEPKCQSWTKGHMGKTALCRSQLHALRKQD